MAYQGKYKRVMLVVPHYRRSHYEYAGLPAGLGYLSEALASAGVEQKIVDMRLGYSYAYLKKSVQDFSPDMIGFSLMSFRYKEHYALMEGIKKDFPGVKITAGGPHVSTFREKVLESCGAVDYGVTLEGEDTLLELCAGAPESKIKGLLYREGSEIKYTGDRPFFDKLDERRFPTYEHFELEKYPNFISLVTSRGCPHSCIFCPVQLTIGKKLRVRSPGSVLAEIDHWYKKGMRVFNVVDDNFTVGKKRLMDICEGIRKGGYDKAVFSCRNGIRADTVDRSALESMKEAGFNYLAFGVESASEKMLKLIKKGETLESIDRAVREACDLGFMVTLFFIVGLPEETMEDVQKSVDFAMRYPVFDVRFYNPIPFPGTELYDRIAEKGLFSPGCDDYLNELSHWVAKPIFSTPEIPFEERTKLYSELNGNIKKHTFKTKLKFASHMSDMFSELGVPRFLSKVLARIYYTEAFQTYVVESGLAEKMKKLLRFMKPRKTGRTAGSGR